MENRLEKILSCVVSNEEDTSVQKIQTRHRIKLVDYWKIPVEAKILEIGCGQGDTTAVLAEAVGEKGFVYGVDIAPSTYGSPVTLGEAYDILKSSPLGDRVHMDFETDILSDDIDFPENHFDFGVISHCLWYFNSLKDFDRVLLRLKKWCKYLCFAEWDTRIKRVEQYPHFFAAIIQAQCECFKENSFLNVHIVLSPSEITAALESSGWNIQKSMSIFTPDLQDAKWEIDIVTNCCKKALKDSAGISEKMTKLIETEIDALEKVVTNIDPLPMNVFVLKAGK